MDADLETKMVILESLAELLTVLDGVEDAVTRLRDITKKFEDTLEGVSE